MPKSVWDKIVERRLKRVKEGEYIDPVLLIKGSVMDRVRVARLWREEQIREAGNWMLWRKRRIAEERRLKRLKKRKQIILNRTHSKS